MPGPPKTPTNVAILRGNPGKAGEKTNLRDARQEAVDCLTPCLSPVIFTDHPSMLTGRESCHGFSPKVVWFGAKGESDQAIIQGADYTHCSRECAASALQLHSDSTFLLDAFAAHKLETGNCFGGSELS
ncbi:MAG: hypothetical protein ABIH23_05350 [bacterium]